MKKILTMLSLFISVSALANFEPLADAQIVITAGESQIIEGATASSMTISFSGIQAKQVYKLLGNTPGVIEKGSTRTSANQEVACWVSYNLNGLESYACISSHGL